MTVVKVYVNAKVETSIVELETEFVDKETKEMQEVENVSSQNMSVNSLEVEIFSPDKNNIEELAMTHDPRRP